MKHFRKFLFFTVLALAIALCFISDNSNALAFDMVNPTGSSEGFTIINDENEDVNLKDYTITDNEGDISFVTDFILKPDETLTILSNKVEDWLHINEYITFDSELIEEYGFTLNDSGDDIYIINSENQIVDCFAYGDVSPDIDIEIFQKIPKKNVAQRNHAFGIEGNDRYWTLHVPGRTQYHFERNYKAEAHPFSFPESKEMPLLNELQNASESIIISMYTFDNQEIASVLKKKLSDGINVKIFLEGQPAGGIDENEIEILTSLYIAGAEIKLIKSVDGYKRFDYVHTKYCVIDDITTIITSENWTDFALNNNRGWGVSIKSEECAEYITNIFYADFYGMDVYDFRSIYPTSLPGIINEYRNVEYDPNYIECDITPVLSPDYSYISIEKFIKNTKERLYSQQLNVEYSWLTSDDNPIQWLDELGKNGVDTRLFVDVTYANPNDDDPKDGYGIFTGLMDSENIQVRFADNGVLVHNKGIISDNRTWIGSMNWTETSINENRELSVIIDSEEFTDYFESLFCEDWGNEYSGKTEIIIKTQEARYGEYCKFDASSSSVPFGSVFRWDFNSDGVADKEGTTAEYKIYKETEVTLTIIDMKGNIISQTITVNCVEIEGEFNLPDGPVKYIPLVILCTVIFIIRRYRDR